MSCVFGWAVEFNASGGNGFVSAAVKEDNGKIRCHDISGFFGSWDMKSNGKFFETISGQPTCPLALKQANEYAYNQENTQ